MNPKVISRMGNLNFLDNTSIVLIDSVPAMNAANMPITLSIEKFSINPYVPMASDTGIEVINEIVIASSPLYFNASRHEIVTALLDIPGITENP